MITGLDHIAIAVPDLEAAIQRFMADFGLEYEGTEDCLLYTSPSPRDRSLSRMPSSA